MSDDEHEGNLDDIDDDLSFMAVDSDAKPVVLPEVMEAITRLRQQRALLAQLKETYAEEKKKELYLSRVIVPSILDSFPTPISRLDVETDDGRVTVTVKEDVSAKIPKDITRKANALVWLSANGAGSLIRDAVTVDDPPEWLLTELDARGVAYGRDRMVNAASLAAWFREKFGIKKNSVASMEKTDVPPDISCFRYRTTEIK